MRVIPLYLWSAVLFVTYASEPVHATTEVTATNSELQAVAKMSIEELMDVTVTSASQKSQKLSDVAAAMTVISAEDIRRSGATNLPDLLRYVPGVEVGEVNNANTSVTIRGFGGIYASKLLVLVDGRSIYNPNYGGVDWAYQKIMMDNIERVEVIRGPGATIWGANAVNGVINIITKDAKDVQGGMVGVIYGSKEQGTGEFRYGFKPARDLDIYVYGQYENEAAGKPVSSIGRFDDCQDYQGGFRADYRPTVDDHFRLSSEVSSTAARDIGVPLSPSFSPYTKTGDAENVNFVYEHQFESDNHLTVQAYYDRFTRSSDPTSVYANIQCQTQDIQVRHSLPLNILPIKQELVYGVEYRVIETHFAPAAITWRRAYRNDQTVSLFAQTDMHLIENVLTLTVGTKYEHNDYTGNELQPSARLLWKINDQNSLWCSISRAVRVPTAVEYNMVTPLSANPNLKSEELTAYELGYRVEPMTWLSFDIAGFYNHYDNLIGSYLQTTTGTLIFEQFQNADTYGIEPSFRAKVQPWWTVSGSYSLLMLNTNGGGIPSNYIYTGSNLENVDPRNQFSIRSSFDLPNNIDIDMGGRYVDKISGANGYFVVDVRVGWRPTPAWEISVVGQNLFMADHIENLGTAGSATYVSPEVYGKVVFKF